MEIIHCDLKPSNVLLKGNRGDWRGFMAAVCDFGLSKMVHSNTKPESKPFGTLVYMAPERFKRNMCKKSDIYSWGIILYQVVTSTEPYKDIPSGKERPGSLAHCILIRVLISVLLSVVPEACHELYHGLQF